MNNAIRAAEGTRDKTVVHVPCKHTTLLEMRGPPTVINNNINHRYHLSNTKCNPVKPQPCVTPRTASIVGPVNIDAKRSRSYISNSYRICISACKVDHPYCADDKLGGCTKLMRHSDLLRATNSVTDRKS